MSQPPIDGGPENPGGPFPQQPIMGGQQQPMGQVPQPPPGGAAPLSQAEDGQWAMLSHFLNVVLLVPALVIYIVFKDRGPRVAVESKEALNWTINVSGAVIALNIVQVIFSVIPVLGLFSWLLFSLLTWAVIIVNVIFAIMGGMKVKDGGSYRYPWNYHWIK